MFKPFDLRQSVFRGLVQQIFPWIAGQNAQTVISSIDKELTPPLKVDAQNPASLTVNVGPSVVANTVANRNKSLAFVNGVIPTIVAETVTFPAASGGNIVVSTGASTPLTLPSGNYVQALLTIDSLSKIHVTIGTPDPTEANLVVPPPAVNLLPFAYVTLHNLGGVIQNVAQNKIYQVAAPVATASSGGGSGAAGWIAKNAALPSGSTSYTVNLIDPMADLSYVILPMMSNTIDVTPQYQQVEVTGKTLTSFTFQWNAPLNSSNYTISYIIPPKSALVAEFAIPASSSAPVVPLLIPQNGSNYGIVGVTQNLVDANPQFQSVLITNQTSSGFTASLVDPTNSGNYSLVHLDSPTAQIAVNSGVSSFTASLPVAYGNTGYSVVGVLSNVTDALPVTQPMIITGKTGSDFTISFNTNTPTANYKFTYYVLPVTT